MEPKNIEVLKQMAAPTRGVQVQLFVCAVKWIRKIIPAIEELTAPLLCFLETVYKRAGKKTERVVARVRLVGLS